MSSEPPQPICESQDHAGIFLVISRSRPWLITGWEVRNTASSVLIQSFIEILL
jgi:hypothetical protein